MRQDEIMVGDWLMYHPERIDGNDGFEPYPVTVHALDIEDAELFEPIPLTREILEKNGFEYIERTGCPFYGYKTNVFLNLDVYCIYSQKIKK